MSSLTLLWRQFSQERWPALVLALSVAILAAVAGVVPRLMSDLDDRQLGQTLAGLSTTQGDVMGSWAFDPYSSSVPLPEEGDDPWVAHLDAGRAIRDQQPEPLRSLLADPQVVGQVNTEVELVPPQETGYYLASFALLVDPQLSDQAELLDGAWPTQEGAEGSRAEVAVLGEVAEKMGWAVGSEVGEDFVVSALFRPIDPDSRRWEHVPLGRTYTEPTDPDRGVAISAGLFLPETYKTSVTGQVGPQSWDTSMTLRMWFGLDGGQIRSSGIDVAELRAQLTALLAQRSPSSTVEGSPEIRLTTELGTALGRVVAQQNITRSVLAVAAIGPIAVALALVVLAARLVLQRRQAWLELLNARGLTPEQVRRQAAIEGALLSLPAAALGHLAAIALIPGPRPVSGWLVAALAAAVAPIALAVGASRIGSRRTRTDLSPHAGRWRLVGEALAVLAALAATWQLLTRPQADAADGVDLLGAATPVLLTIAAALLVLRLYPLPLRALASWLKGRKGLTGFLGAVRSLRDPAGGVIPVTTVLLGATLAVLGATLVGTIATGTERATWTNNGSHIHLSGPRVLDPMVEELIAVDGVAHVARLYEASDNAKITVGGQEHWGRVLLADPALQDVYAPMPGGSPVPASVFSGAELVVGGDLHATAPTASVPGLGEMGVAAELRALPGATPGSMWVLADVTRWTDRAPTSTVALISVEPGADMREVSAAISELMPNSRVTNVAAELESLRDSPTIDGLTRAFLILAGTTAALMALGVIGSQLLGGGERNHLAAILRTLGLRPGQLRALTAWEVGPAIVLALIVGVGLGIALAALMLAGLDFRSLTGGTHSPDLHLHWPTLAAVIGALVATMALAVAVTSWSAGRTNLAEELRIGDQR